MSYYFDKPTRYNWVAIIILWILMIIFAATIGSCTGKKGYLKYKANHPEQFAKDCAAIFPNKEDYSKGETIVKSDTIYKEGKVIDCPEPTISPDGKVNPGKVNCPGERIIRDSIFRTDTLKIENTAKIIHLNNVITDKDKSLSELTGENKTLKFILWFVLGTLVVIGLGMFLYLRNGR